MKKIQHWICEEKKDVRFGKWDSKEVKTCDNILVINFVV